jgi:hypothetical protein
MSARRNRMPRMTGPHRAPPAHTARTPCPNKPPFPAPIPCRGLAPGDGRCAGAMEQMAKKMLIDATHAEETRVVVVDGNKVEEFDFETVNKRQLAGNIYLAKVTRVEPSLQAAFVDYGGNRHGFLAFAEIHPDYYQIPVADRKALMEEERAYAARSADEDEETNPVRRRSRPAQKSQCRPRQARSARSRRAVAGRRDHRHGCRRSGRGNRRRCAGCRWTIVAGRPAGPRSPGCGPVDDERQ